jgi:hypothetical protein
MQTPERKAEELARIRDVARVRGGTVVPAKTDPPDGYLVEPDGTRIPVEVVRGYNPPPATAVHPLPPARGSLTARAEAEIAKHERELVAAGHGPIVSYVHDDREAVVEPLTETTRLRLPTTPMNGKALQAVSLAIGTKAQKGYAPGTILIVDYHGFRLDADELRAIGRYAGLFAPDFREVWVYSQHEDVAQRATFDD